MDTFDTMPPVSENPTLPAYEKPELKVMTETEILSAIQINALGTSWWVM